MKVLEIYVSGICKGNPGNGGFAYAVNDEMGVTWYKGSNVTKETTNNQMELAAVIEALRVVIKNENLTEVSIKVFSDSAYIVNGFTDNWIGKWEKNGWKNNKGENVINKEYWSTLNELVKETNSTFERVKRNNLRIKDMNAIVNRKMKSLRKHIR